MLSLSSKLLREPADWKVPSSALPLLDGTPTLSPLTPFSPEECAYPAIVDMTNAERTLAMQIDDRRCQFHPLHWNDQLHPSRRRWIVLAHPAHRYQDWRSLDWRQLPLHHYRHRNIAHRDASRRRASDLLSNSWISAFWFSRIVLLPVHVSTFPLSPLSLNETWRDRLLTPLLPVSASVSLSFTFGGIEYPMRSTDFNNGATSSSGRTCVGAIFALESQGGRDTIIIGDAFLKNVYK